MPNDLETIAVIVNALSSNKEYLSLEYYSTNYEKEKNEKQAKQDSVF